MTTPQIAVIFDTNAYRYLVSGKTSVDVLKEIQILREKENSKNVAAYGSQIVGMEMLSNLVEGPSGFNYNDCLHGIIAMANHCYDDTKAGFRIIPHPYLQIAKAFFDTIPSSIEEKSRNLAGVITDFKVNYVLAESHHRAANTYHAIKDYLENEEEEFSTNIIDLITGIKQEIKKQYPKLQSHQFKKKVIDYIDNGPLEPYMAIAIIHSVANTLQITLSQQENARMAYSLSVNFPQAVAFYRWVCHKVVEDNIDMQAKASKKSRWNWRWDYEVSFLISDHKLDQRTVILVTSDINLTEMLQELGFSDRVMSLKEYLEYLDK